MKKLISTLCLAVAFCISGLTVNAQSCDDIFTNITANSSFYNLSFNGDILFDGATCGPLFITPANVIVTGDLVLFNVACGNTYTWTTCGLVSFDSYIRIWNASDLTLQASNDDDFGCGANIFASTLTWLATFDGSIWLSVNQWPCNPANQLNYDLLMQCVPGQGCVTPANDDVCGAEFMGTPAIGSPVSASWDNTFASADGPSPGPGTVGPGPSCDALDGWCSFETIVDNDLWFTFIAPPSGNVDIETITDDLFGDTQIALWQIDDCFSAALSAVEIAANDDGGTVFMSRLFDQCGYITLTPGELYYIQVDGYAGWTGTGVVEVREVAAGGPTPNDDPCDAEVIPSVAPGSSTTVAFNNACANPSAASPGAGTVGAFPSCDAIDGWCSFETVAQNDVWFSYTVPAGSGGTINFASSFDLSPFDTQIAVWSANGDCSNISGYTELGANDDGGNLFSSSLTLDCLEPGTTVLIQVDGFSGTEGSGTVTITDLGVAPLEADGGECQTVYYGYTYTGNFGCTELNGTAMGGVAGYTYQWFDNNGNVVGTTASITVCPAVDTWYTLCVTDQRGCTVCDDTPTYVQSIDVRCGVNEKQLTHKVSVCHVPPGNPGNAHTICIDYHGVPAHIDPSIGHSGCFLGPCDQLTCDGQPLLSGSSKTASAEANGYVVEAFPNPFSALTSIQFTFQNDEKVTVEVYDITGSKVATLFQGTVMGGLINVVDFDGTQLGSGVYIYRISTESGKVATDKLYLMK
ncbi:MAG: T9SS type A sorting domain-containing protein [Bacteroidia bacterium]|nr:T9SS type A sorting domain-containing protein [Bacteroidia bacterium]